MTEKNRKALYIAEQCRRAEMTLAGAAGVLINFDCESLISEMNVEDRYHSDTGKTDADYVRLVDDNPEYDFETDNGKHYGFGLAQWTLASRKRAMRKFHRERNVSIADFRTQVDFFLDECRKDFPGVWETLCSSNNPYQCGEKFCLIYENPDNAIAQAAYRGGRAQGWYDWLAENQNAEIGIPETRPAEGGSAAAADAGETDEDGNVIEKTWPPRMLQKGRCSGWPEVKLLQAALRCHGYNVLIDGIFGDALEEKVVKFQKEAFPGDASQWDGVAGPLTWAAALNCK